MESILQIVTIIVGIGSILSMVVIIIFTISIMKNNQMWFKEILNKHEKQNERQFAEHNKDIQELYNRQNLTKTETDIAKILVQEIKSDMTRIWEKLEGIKKDTVNNSSNLKYLTNKLEDFLSKFKG